MLSKRRLLGVVVSDSSSTDLNRDDLQLGNGTGTKLITNRMKRKDLFYCIKQVLSLQRKLKCTVFCTEYKQYRVEEGPERCLVLLSVCRVAGRPLGARWGLVWRWVVYLPRLKRGGWSCFLALRMYTCTESVHCSKNKWRFMAEWRSSRIAEWLSGRVAEWQSG